MLRTLVLSYYFLIYIIFYIVVREWKCIRYWYINLLMIHYMHFAGSYIIHVYTRTYTHTSTYIYRHTSIHTHTYRHRHICTFSYTHRHKHMNTLHQSHLQTYFYRFCEDTQNATTKVRGEHFDKFLKFSHFH